MEGVGTAALGLGLLARGYLWLGMPAATAYIIVASPTTAALLPIILLPTVLSVYRRRSMASEDNARTDILAHIFWIVGTLGMFGVLVIQSLVSYGLARLLLGSQVLVYLKEFGRTSTKGLAVEDVVRRAQMAHKWQYFALLAFFTYVLAGGLEELLKYAPIAIIRRHEPDSLSRTAKAKRYIQYAVAAALGFSTIENVGFTMAAVKAGEGALNIAMTVAERIVFAAPGHLLCAALSAINAARAENVKRTPWSWWKILAPSVWYHGTFDFLLFSLSAWNGNVGWIHPTDATSIVMGLAIVLGLQGALALQVRQGWQDLNIGENGEPASEGTDSDLKSRDEISGKD